MTGFAEPSPGSEAVGRRQPAPGGLELVRAFLNSADIEAGTDAFATPAGVGRWLSEHELPAGDPAPGGADRDRLVAVREALRDLITCREHGESPDEARGADEARRVLEQAARSNPLTVAFDPDGRIALRTAAAGADGLIARVLSEIQVAAVAGTWERLKVCRNDTCRWAYYDASRNRSGVWCTMAVCGNRSKGRALRERRRAAPTS